MTWAVNISEMYSSGFWLICSFLDTFSRFLIGKASTTDYHIVYMKA